MEDVIRGYRSNMWEGTVNVRLMGAIEWCIPWGFEYGGRGAFGASTFFCTSNCFPLFRSFSCWRHDHGQSNVLHQMNDERVVVTEVQLPEFPIVEGAEPNFLLFWPNSLKSKMENRHLISSEHCAFNTGTCMLKLTDEPARIFSTCTCSIKSKIRRNEKSVKTTQKNTLISQQIKH